MSAFATQGGHNNDDLAAFRFMVSLTHDLWPGPSNSGEIFVHCT